MKIDIKGNVLWNTMPKPGTLYEAKREVLSLVSIADGFYVLSLNTDPYGITTTTYLSKFSFSGNLQYHLQISYEASFIYSYSSGLLLGYNSKIENGDFNYGVIKFKSEKINTTPGVSVNFFLNSYPYFIIHASPINVKEGVKAIEFYVNGTYLTGALEEFYEATWQPSSRDNKITVKVISNTDKIVVLDTIPCHIFKYGGQAEDYYNIFSDLGAHSISNEDDLSLDAASSVRLPDVGDKIKMYLGHLDDGIYKIKVRVRSGSFTTTSSNPTSYWPNGYSISINGTASQFKGDASSLSKRSTAYGGSYWGTMISNEVRLKSIDDNFLIIEANMAGGGIDYFELEKQGSKLEAEIIGAKLVNTSGVKFGNHPDLSNGSSIALFVKGDKTRLTFNALPGKYLLKVRVRTPKHDAFYTNAYSFWVNKQPTTFSGDISSISNFTKAYGGSYWGDMTAEVTLTEVENSVDVQTNSQWQGVDYIELILLRRLEAETIYSGLVDPGSHYIEEEKNSALSGGSSATLWDVGDKLRLTFYTPPGKYILKAHIRTPKKTAFYNNGYSFWVNEVATTFTGDINSISDFNPSYGGSYWGDMAAQVTLDRNQNYLDVQSNIAWQGVDYIEVIPVANTSSRVAFDESIVEDLRNAVIIFPNPIQSKINISLPTNVNGNISLTLIDVLGKTHLYKKQDLNNQKELTLDLPYDNLKEGIYVLKIKGAGIEKAIRLTKE